MLFNPAFPPDPSGDAEVDAVRHVQAGFAPAIVFFGDKDFTYRPGFDAVHKRLKALGNSGVDLWIANGKGHGFFNLPPWLDITLSEADRFLVKHGFLDGVPTLPPTRGGENLQKAP